MRKAKTKQPKPKQKRTEKLRPSRRRVNNDNTNPVPAKEPAKKGFADTRPLSRAITSTKITTGFDTYGHPLPFETMVADEAITVAASYAEVLAIDFRSHSLLVLSMHNTGANTLLYQIWGSLKAGTTAPAFSDDSWTQAGSEGTISAAGDAYETLFDRWRWITVRMVQSGGATSAKAYGRMIKL